MVIEELTKVFRTVFEDDSIKLKGETTADDIDGWDSLSHVLLILAVENHFKIKFTTGELLNLKNVGDLASRIIRKRPDLQ
jgi:acyl carrier protein